MTVHPSSKSGTNGDTHEMVIYGSLQIWPILKYVCGYIAHTGIGCHRGYEAAKYMLRNRFSWYTLSEDVLRFFIACIHSLSTTGGSASLVPSVLKVMIEIKRVPTVLIFEFIEVGPSCTGEIYILMLYHDNNGYAWFYPAVSCGINCCRKIW